MNRSLTINAVYATIERLATGDHAAAVRELKRILTLTQEDGAALNLLDEIVADATLRGKYPRKRNE